MTQTQGGLKGSQKMAQGLDDAAKYDCGLLVLQMGQCKLCECINSTSSLHGRQPDGTEREEHPSTEI